MSLTIDNLSKNVGDFSITKSYKDFIVNHEFSNKGNSSQSTVFPTISAISEQIGEVIYENILNYIDNIGNVDVCKINGLKQHCKMLEIDYSIVDKIQTFPSEIQTLLDVFSINPSFLLSTGFFKSSEFDSEFSSGFSQDKYNEVVSACFYNTLTGIINTKYVNYSETSSSLSSLDSIYSLSKFDTNINVVYKNISSELFDLDEVNLIKESMISSKNEYCVPLNFKESEIVTNIENEFDSFENYTINEQHILSLEINNRKDYMYVPQLSSRLTMLPTSRFAWYKEKKVKDYIQFVLTNHCLSSFDSKIYDFDSRYLELNDNITISTLINGDLTLNYAVIGQCAQSMMKIAKQLCKVRYQIKEIPQKYYIRGSFLLLNYLINDILFDEGYTDAHVSLQTYDDNTEYFNLKTENTDKAYNKSKATIPYYNDIVKNGLVDIDNFYLSSVQQQTQLKCTSSDYDEFLLDIYRYGASKSYIDRESMELCATNDTNKQIALSYFGNKFGYKPWLNFKNQTHPSYQIHPCLYNFVKYANIPQMIKHSFDLVMNDDYQVNIVNDISNYVGTYGNIVSAWNNGVDEFFGYNSRYEESPHRARNGTKCIYTDYDGFAYDEAYNYFIQNRQDCINSIKDRNGNFYEKYYKHLHLKANEAKYYADMISDAANAYPEKVWTIEQYALDIYHNCYCILSDNTIWIRFDSHVLPIPLSAFLGDKGNNISFVEFNKDVNVILFKSGNNYYAGKIQMQYTEKKPKYYQYAIKSIEKFSNTSGKIIKYENCIGLLNLTGSTLEIELYNYNTEKIETISSNVSNTGKVNVEFDQIQIAYLSTFDCGTHYPAYMEGNSSSTKDILSGIKIVVDTYDIVDTKYLRKINTQYFSCQNVENGLIPLFHNIKYTLQDDSEAQMFQLMDSTECISATYPYGRLTNYRNYISNLSANSEKSIYLSSLDGKGINVENVLSITSEIGFSTDFEEDKYSRLIYVLNNGSHVTTNLSTYGRIENDKYGNNQYVISASELMTDIKAFENNLSNVVKCSEQDWTRYYDISLSNNALHLSTALSTQYDQSNQYLIDVDGNLISVINDANKTLYVNYKYAYCNESNPFVSKHDITYSELPSNTYLKLLPGMAGILHLGNSEDSQLVYVKNFSDESHTRIAIQRFEV